MHQHIFYLFHKCQFDKKKKVKTKHTQNIFQELKYFGTKTKCSFVTHDNNLVLSKDMICLNLGILLHKADILSCVLQGNYSVAFLLLEPSRTREMTN